MPSVKRGIKDSDRWGVKHERQIPIVKSASLGCY